MAPRNKKRSKYNVGAFSSVPLEMQKTPAFQSLTASALRVLLWALNKNYRTVSNSEAISKPTFKLTNTEAKNEYGLNSATFTNAKNQLEDRGFLEWVKRGGLKGCNGVCSEYCLSSEWKKWVSPPQKTNSNLIRARAALKRKKTENEIEIRYGKDLKSIKPARRVFRRNRLS